MEIPYAFTEYCEICTEYLKMWIGAEIDLEVSGAKTIEKSLSVCHMIFIPIAKKYYHNVV